MNERTKARLVFAAWMAACVCIGAAGLAYAIYRDGRVFGWW